MCIREARTAGQMPRANATVAVASAPTGRTSRSKANPVEVSALRASPSGAIGERAMAIATAPAAPTRPTTRFRAMPSVTNCRRSTPRAVIVGKSSLSTMLWRASAWPTTASPTNAARAARIHHPMAWG